MRYGDWDVLLFPQDSEVPFKEFKVACHMVHDYEFSLEDLSIGLPTLCCFVPSLRSGSAFQISLHSWSAPSVSQFTSSYAKQDDEAVFEARVFIDGKVLSSTTFDATGEWPHIIKHSFGTPKNPNLDLLRFPDFCPELLQQNFWSAADDLGRIKLIISEAIPRNSSAVPFERTKNVIAFSFQHAPLEILEARSIAWPSSMMWCHTPFMASTSVPTYSSVTADSHAHSPRRERLSQSKKHALHATQPTESEKISGEQQPLDAEGANTNDRPPISQEAVPDPFVDTNAYFEWMNAIKFGHVNPAMLDCYPVRGAKQRHERRSSTDTSMPDYVSNQGYPLASGIDVLALKDDSVSHKAEPKVPSNSPVSNKLLQNEQEGTQIAGVPFPMLPQGVPLSYDFANSLTNSLLLTQPPHTHDTFHIAQFPENEIKSRKEGLGEVSLGHAQPLHQDIRKISQQFDAPIGSTSVSRQVTPSKGREQGEVQQRQVSTTSQSTERDPKRLRSGGSTPADTLRQADGVSSTPCKAVHAMKKNDQ